MTCGVGPESKKRAIVYHHRSKASVAPTGISWFPNKFLYSFYPQLKLTPLIFSPPESLPPFPHHLTLSTNSVILFGLCYYCTSLKKKSTPCFPVCTDLHVRHHSKKLTSGSPYEREHVKFLNRFLGYLTWTNFSISFPTNLFLFTIEYSFIVQVYHIFTINTLTVGHIGCFHLLAIVNGEAMKTDI